MYRRLTRRLAAAGAGLMALTALAGTVLPASGAAAATTPAAVPAIAAGAAATTPAGLTPANLQQAYGLQAATSGSGQTVAVVTAYGDPSLAADLAAYRTQYGLSPCTAADGCLTQVSQAGTSTLPGAAAGWDTPVTESADAISAICPNCHILVVEAASTAITDLGAAENEAAVLGAKFIDNDWYTTENASETSWDTSYFTHPGVAITAPAGDGGYGTSYPAASPDVIAAGGTTLTADASSPRGYDEAAWTGSGSGCSAYEPKPSWQTDTGCTTRTMNDLSADAGTSVAYYDTPAEAGWGQAQGTGIAAAIIAAAYADAGTPGTSDNPAEYPYQHPGGSYTTPGNAYTSPTGLNNITTGSDGTCSVTYLCTAGTGYNAPTGLGTPSTALSLTTSGETGTIQVHTAANICLDSGPITSSDTGEEGPGGYVYKSGPAVLENCGGTQSQDWSVKADGSIRNTTDALQSYGCLDAQGATTSGTPVYVNNSCDSPLTLQQGAREWTFTSSGELIDKASGLCLDDPAFKTAAGTALDVYTCEGSANERWTAPYDRPAATGPIKSKVSSSKCVGDAGDSTANGNKIVIYDCLGDSSQNWDIQPNGTIKLHGQSGCLAASADGMTQGTLIVYYACNGDTSETWAEHSDGSLVNVRSGLCLADLNANTTNGLQLQLSTCNGSTQQTWTLP